MIRRNDISGKFFYLIVLHALTIVLFIYMCAHDCDKVVESASTLPPNCTHVYTEDGPWTCDVCEQTDVFKKLYGFYECQYCCTVHKWWSNRLKNGKRIKVVEWTTKK